MKLITICVVLIFVGGLKAQDLTAKQIIEKAEGVLKGIKTTKAEITITSVRPKWSRTMTLKTWSEGTKNTMILITSPAKEKGTVFLMLDKEVWNWVPSIERTIKLPPSMMMQSWMGTDFTNDDLVQQSSILTDYTHEIVDESVIDDKLCYKIKLTPKEDAVVAWGKIYTWVDKEDFFQLRVEFYDEDGFMINVMKSDNIAVLGGKKIPTRMEMIPMEKEGQKTIMEFINIEFDTPIADNFFSIQNMKQLK